MGATRVSFFYDAIWVKGTVTPKRTRWHQDQPYYPVDGSQFCAIWVPLDPVDEESSLELVRGSHRWGRWFEPELTRAVKTCTRPPKAPSNACPTSSPSAAATTS